MGWYACRKKKMKSHNTKGFNKELDKKRFEIISQYFRGDSCLEIGPGNGYMTKKFIKNFKKVVVVEPDKKYIQNMMNLKIASIYPCRLEELKDLPYPDWCRNKYDTIICSNVLEHIKDPYDFLYKLKKFGNKRTNFIFVVPNATSYNRLLGSELGIIRTPYDLHKNDRKVGHEIMYNLDLFSSLLAGEFKIIKKQSYIYKPFSNSIMEKLPRKIKNYCLNTKMQSNGAEILILARLE